MKQISFRRIPSTSALFTHYLEDWPRVQGFYPENYSPGSIVDFARRQPRLDASHLDALGAALSVQQRSFGSAVRGVDKLAAGAVAIVTGQQPGLLTGPNLSILKAISAIKLARHLEASGVPAVPVFWVAADDHDYEEIQTTAVLNRDSGVCRVNVDLHNTEGLPAGWMRYREDVDAAVQDCLACLPRSEYTPEVRDLVESSYKSGASPVDAFAMMMARIFAGTELVLVNPLDPAIRRLGESTMILAVRKNEELRAALVARSRSIAEAGYHEQVKVDASFTGLFAFRGRSRVPLKPADVGTDLPLSPNVLLRPVVQDTIFPTAAYVAGPAETAYFAQAAAVYETLGRRMPPIFPRISATLLEPRIVRAMEKYGIDFTDLFQGPDFVKRKAVEGVHDGQVFSDVRERLEQELERIRPVLGELDPTLLGALETSRRKMRYQVEALRNKYVNAAAKRDQVLERHLTAINNSLLPEKKLQERLINVLSFLSRYGLGMTQGWTDALSLDTTKHQVITI